MGLKFGLHMMHGIPRQAVTAHTPIENSSFTADDAGDTRNICTWCPDMFGVRKNDAGQAWYDAMFRQVAFWGIDFVKIDDLSNAYHADEIEMIRRAIDRCGRTIVFSTSPGPTDPNRAEHIAANANMCAFQATSGTNGRSLMRSSTCWIDGRELPVLAIGPTQT